MKVLVIGSGGREHALVWKLRQSPRVSKVYCAPGNGGISDEAECLPVDVKSIDSLVALATQIHPDLTVVGPELPLTLGVVDEFTRRGWKTFGPTKAAARLESSKSFAKQFLNRYHIPTAHYAICSSLNEVRETLPRFHPPVVVKADGLAAGKGVVIAKSKEEAITVSSEMLSGKMLGEAGSRVVLEECLQGDELSFLVLSDGERVGPMVLEFNCRFGDPETQPILMRLESDLCEALEASIEGRVSDGDFRWSPDAAVCVVMSSGGYPGTFEVGKKITGLDEADKIERVKIFHAGTTKHDDGYFTAGGRVLGVTVRAADLTMAVQRAYEAVGKISFEGAHYRRDIAARAVKK